MNLILAFILGALLSHGPTENVRRFTFAPDQVIHTSSYGSGEQPVIILPGQVGGAYSFRKVMPELVAAGRKVIIIDLLGSGNSTKPSKADYSLTAQSRRVEHVLDSLGVRDAVIVAHAVSGSVAYRLALHRPDQVKAVVGIDAGASERAGTAGLRKAMNFAPLIKLFGAKRILTGKVKGALEDGAAVKSWVTDEVVKNYTAAYREDAGQMLKVLQAIANAPEPEELAANLPKIEDPVILLVGDRPADKVLSQAKIDLLKNNLRNFEFIRVEGAGVFVQEEKPEAVIQAVLKAGS